MTHFLRTSRPSYWVSHLNGVPRFFLRGSLIDRRLWRPVRREAWYLYHGLQP